MVITGGEINLFMFCEVAVSLDCPFLCLSLCCKMSDRAIFLYSSLATDQIQIVNSRRLEDALSGNKINFLKVDGALPENKEMRDKLFGVSNLRGKYPQCFLEKDGNITFIGLWDECESLIDCNALPADVLAANPQIKTFNSVSAIN